MCFISQERKCTQRFYIFTANVASKQTRQQIWVISIRIGFEMIIYSKPKGYSVKGKNSISSLACITGSNLISYKFPKFHNVKFQYFYDKISKLTFVVVFFLVMFWGFLGFFFLFGEIFFLVTVIK